MDNAATIPCACICACVSILLDYTARLHICTSICGCDCIMLANMCFPFNLHRSCEPAHDVCVFHFVYNNYRQIIGHSRVALCLSFKQVLVRNYSNENEFDLYENGRVDETIFIE